MNRTIQLLATVGLALWAAPLFAEAAVGTAATTSATDTQQRGHVERVIVTSAIINREPSDQLETVSADTTTLYLFTELFDMKGQRISHRWEYNGQLLSEVPFEVNSDRWRGWSSKRLQPLLAGKWTVSVVDSVGNVLQSREFLYGNPR